MYIGVQCSLFMSENQNLFYWIPLSIRSLYGYEMIEYWRKNIFSLVRCARHLLVTVKAVKGFFGNIRALNVSNKIL